MPKERGDIATRFQVKGREPLSKESITLRLPQSVYAALKERFPDRAEMLDWLRELVANNLEK